MDQTTKDLIVRLFDIDSVKFGEFTLKSGILSPIYLDLRITVSYPDVLEAITDQIIQTAKGLEYDVVVGAPYAAIPIATVFSLKTKEPMLLLRKETHEAGTKKRIEGNLVAGQTALVLDDVITDGASKFETIEPLEEVGLKIKDVVIFMDREQGGDKKLAERGYTLHTAVKVTEVISHLAEVGKIDQEMKDKCLKFIEETQV